MDELTKNINLPKNETRKLQILLVLCICFVITINFWVKCSNFGCRVIEDEFFRTVDIA